MVSPNKYFPWIFEQLRDPKWYQPWTGDVFRQTQARWLSRPYRFTGVGSVMKGARWSVKGLIPTIYASTNPDTLHAEVYAKAHRYGFTKTDLLAQLVIAMHWELQAILDLTSPATLMLLDVTTKEITDCDWDAEQTAGTEPITQAIGRAAFEHLAEGLVVPSAQRAGGVNIVFFPSHRRDGSVIQALDEAGTPFMHGLG